MNSTRGCTHNPWKHISISCTLNKTHSLYRCSKYILLNVVLHSSLDRWKYIYIFSSPLNVRQNTIFKLLANLLNMTTLLQGDPNISSNMNLLIFKAVLDFNVQTRRFAMQWQTQLNSYWHKSILSLSLDFWLIFVVVVVFMLFYINTRCCKMNLLNCACERLL